MALLNGFTKDTAKNVQLDAGIIVLNFKDFEGLDNFDGTFNGGNKGTLLGATKGSAQFSATPEMRNIFEDINGARGDYKEGTVIDKWEVVLKATVSEMTATNIKLAMGTATKADKGTKYEILTPKDEIAVGDYQENICWFGKQAGSDKPIIIELKNVLNTTGITFTAEDKNSGSVEVEFRAHRSMDKPNEVPFNIYLPKIDQ